VSRIEFSNEFTDQFIQKAQHPLMPLRVLVILMDPIFQGLAMALMAGEIASLIISRIGVPVIY
jgi:hypothetical protein